jgi:hypothetical protein
VINSTFNVTNLPRNTAGASSAIYSGVTKLAAPTARPIIERPTIISHTDGANACNTAPTMNRMSAMRITRLRPSESASRPLRGEMSSAKSEVEAAMRDLSSVVSGREEREVLIETSVADMTPVSSVPCTRISLDSRSGNVAERIAIGTEYTHSQTAAR